MATKTYKYSELADALIASGTIVEMATDMDGWKKLSLMLADLGEEAFDIYDRISATAHNYDSRQVRKQFSWALNHYDAAESTIGSFLYLCKEAGINISDYVTDSEDALRPISSNGKDGVFDRRKGNRKKTEYKPEELPKNQKLYTLPPAWLEATLPVSYEKSPLARYLAGKFGMKKVNEVFRMYFVGLTRKQIPLREGFSLPINSCIFPQMDVRGMARTAQIMAFDDESGRYGHRTKFGKVSSLIWLHNLVMNLLLKSTENKWGREDDRKRLPYNCLTGLHLLNEKKYPQNIGKPVGVVESASTALCMACYDPDTIWLSTSGCAGIKLLADALYRDATVKRINELTGKEESVSFLQNRDIIIYPDEGKTDSWMKAVDSLGFSHITVSGFMDKQGIAGGDIKDVVMAESDDEEETDCKEPSRPKTQDERLAELISLFPVLGVLVDSLNLELIQY